VDVSPADLPGDGTAASPYEITNASQLQSIEDDLGAHYVLGADVDASGTADWNGGEGFDPIGETDPYASTEFTGTFDGAGHTVTGLTIRRSGADEVGLFGTIGGSGTVRDVTLANVTVTNGRLVGGLAGKNSGTVTRVAVAGRVAGSEVVGGVVGTNTGGVVQLATATADVTGGDTLGGVAGKNFGTVRNASASGTVDGTDVIGGLVGYNHGGTVTDAYAVGTVVGSTAVGGLVGLSESRFDYDATESDAYWDTNATGQSTSAGDGVGLSTAEMTGEGATTNVTGLSFPVPWQVRPNGYPGLAWRVDGPPRAVIDLATPVVTGERVGLDATGSADDGSIVAYEWDVGADGTVEYTGPTAGHVFTERGPATIRLRVTDDDGKRTTTTRSLTVEYTETPRARFNVTPTSPRPTEQVVVNASASVDPDGTVTGYAWEFDGDGTIDATGERVSTTYPSVGTRTVRLRVTDDTNVTNATTRTVTVVENRRPELSVSAPTEVGIGDVVELTATASDPDGRVASVTWDVDGDGTAEYNGSAVEHAFGTAGRRTIVATATDELGGSTTTRVTVTVAIERTGGGTADVPGHSRFRVDAANTGHNPDEVGPIADVTTDWTFPVGSRVFTSPAVVDGTVYAGSYSTTQGDRVVAVDARTGTRHWEFRTTAPVGGNPTVYDGTVYVGTDGGTLYALDAATGTEEWAVGTGTTLSSPVVVDGVLYVGGSGLYALDPATGEVLFETPVSGGSSPAVVNGTVYVGSGSNAVYAVDATNGTVRWTAGTNGTVESSPAVVDGTVYVGSHDGSVYAFDADDGSREWRFETGALVRSSPAVADGTVYVGSDDGYVYALDATTGRPAWTYETSGSSLNGLPPDNRVSSSPIVVGNTVYVGNDGFDVYALNADDGSVRWSYATGYDVYATPAVVDGVVYAASVDGSLYALSGTTPDPTRAPTARLATTPTAPTPGEEVVLDATGSSDPDGDPLAYEWTQTGGPTVALSGADTSTPSVTVPAEAAGELLSFRVVVGDGTGRTDDATVRIRVESPAPTVAVERVRAPPNDTTRANVTLDVAPDGLASYDVSVTVGNTSVGRLTGLSDVVGSTARVTNASPGNYSFGAAPNRTGSLRAIDLGTLAIETRDRGRTDLTVTVRSLTYPNGSATGTTGTAYADVEGADGTLTVARSAFPDGIPGVSADGPPTDTDGDRRLEDLTGDGTFTFIDVVGFLFALDTLRDAPLTAEQVAALDHSGDDRLGFLDVVDLLFEL